MLVIDAREPELAIVGLLVINDSIVLESEVASISVVSEDEVSDCASVLIGTSEKSVGCARVLATIDDSLLTIELLSREETIPEGSVKVALSVGTAESGTPESRDEVGRP